MKAFVRKITDKLNRLIELGEMCQVGEALGEAWCHLWAKGDYEATEELTTFVRNKYRLDSPIVMVFDQTKEKFLYKWDDENRI